ncbi:MAG: superoxide dismutase [Ni] [Sedimentisphaerales bacterium]
MSKTVRKKNLLCGIFVLAILLASMAYSHCQIPCGIYGDKMRFDMIAEHITTIEKSMKLIAELSEQGKPNMNQIVRWVRNKDEHADEMSHIISYYFMAQRVKLPPEDDVKAYNEYVKKLTLLHRMLVYTMKAKQTTDLSNVEKLRALLTKFQEEYFGKAG